jgi:hypothetical protein
MTLFNETRPNTVKLGASAIAFPTLKEELVGYQMASIQTTLETVKLKEPDDSSDRDVIGTFSNLAVQ